MEAISLFIEYVYIPLAFALYYLHMKYVKLEIKYVKLETKMEDYHHIKKDITEIKMSLHHLIKIREEES